MGSRKAKKEDIARYLIINTISEMTRLMMRERKCSVTEALDTIYTSDTLRKLEDTENGMYIQSPGYVYDELKTETGGFHTQTQRHNTVSA